MKDSKTGGTGMIIREGKQLHIAQAEKVNKHTGVSYLIFKL